MCNDNIKLENAKLKRSTIATLIRYGLKSLSANIKLIHYYNLFYNFYIKFWFKISKKKKFKTSQTNATQFLAFSGI